MSGPYTPIGPFNQGGIAGINKTFLDGVENWIKQVDSNASILVTVNGQTSGHADMYQYLQGTVKKTIINLVNYRITANQTLALPTPYTARAAIWVYETNGGHVACLASSVAQNIKVITALSGTGGTQSTQTFIQQWSQGQIDAAWDTLQLQSANQLGAANGVIVIEGF